MNYVQKKVAGVETDQTIDCQIYLRRDENMECTLAIDKSISPV